MTYRRHTLKKFPCGAETLGRILIVAAIVIAVVCSGQSPAVAAQSVAGKASGTLTIDGKSIALKYAYAMLQPNTFDKDKTDIAVLLTERPLNEGAVKDAEELDDAVGKEHGWAFFKIDDAGRPIHEVIDHPSAGGGRLMMSGFTQAGFVQKKRLKDRLEGSFATRKVEDFLNHTYEIKVEFSAPLLQARRPEPLPDAKTGETLPPDGGEPGKAYAAYLKAVRDKDIPTIRKLAPVDEQGVSESELRQMLEFMAAISPSDVKIIKGYIRRERAVLYLEGVLDGEKQYGTVELAMKGRIWKVAKEHWADTPPKK